MPETAPTIGQQSKRGRSDFVPNNHMKKALWPVIPLFPLSLPFRPEGVFYDDFEKDF